MNHVANDILMHYGKSIDDGAPGRGSGRYPKGSGENPNQHRVDVLTRIQDYKNQGMTPSQIAEAMGLKNTSQLRVLYTHELNLKKTTDTAKAKAMLEDGKSKAEVARYFGINESTLRGWLRPVAEKRLDLTTQITDHLRELVDEKGMVEVGKGAELDLKDVLGSDIDISKERLKQALYTLELEGYHVYGGGVPQATNPGKQTNIKVLCAPDKQHKDIYNYGEISMIKDYTVREDPDGTEHLDKGFEFPKSMDSDRLLIRYRDDIMPNGHKAVENDGTVEIRPGVADLDLQGSRYAQVRILVDNNKYIKGMAYYSNDIPDGYDVVFNTNKNPGEKALKDIKKDPNNPFGALLREEGGQYHYTDENGERQLGLINKTRQEGDWGEWSHDLPHQFLAKQSKQLMEKQLNLALVDKKAEYDEICALTNPTVKKHLLESFADDCDAAAVDMKAAALPRQQYQVILPMATMPDNEVYAPNYRNGEKVALIRFPHGGTFEIPILTVNNKRPDAIRAYGSDAKDAVVVNSKVAERLSGADFDGDTVMVIPCNSPGNNVKIIATNPLKGLVGFDPKTEYRYDDTKTTINKKGEEVTHYYRNGREFKVMKNTQNEMGQISNLITDMTLKGAGEDKLARAVRHSMVVIDAEKHKLDYKQSYRDNRIDLLKKEYQEHYVDGDDTPHYGASTLLSSAKSPYPVLKTKGSPKTNVEGAEWYDPSRPEGAKVYKHVVETYYDKKTKKEKVRMQDSTRMAETDDARTLSSGTYQEEIYARYANTLKDMANKARLEILHTGKVKYNKDARETYAPEVDSLLSQLNRAEKNAPREKQAQLATNSQTNAIFLAHPDLTNKEKKKLRNQYLAQNRIRYGAHRREIDITPRGWEAIQAGAITETTLKRILRFANQDKVREYATPRTTTELSSGKQARIKAMQNSGYSISQIADAIGVSRSTVAKYMN